MNRFTTSDGLSLAYDDEGAGPPVLCLPGLTRNARDFEPLLAARPGAARYIRLDPRGRGRSDPAPDPLTYAVPVEARDALELLDHLGIERALVLGTSRGGLLAMLLALTAKERLAGVILNDVGPVLPEAAIEAILSYVGLRPAAKTYARMAAVLAEMNAGLFDGLTLADWERIARVWFVQEAEGLGLTYDPRLREALLAQRAEGPAPDLWPLFDALEGVPLGVIRGANSGLLTADTLALMQARRPDAVVATVPGRGHVPFLDEPESLAVFDALLAKAAP